MVNLNNLSLGTNALDYLSSTSMSNIRFYKFNAYRCILFFQKFKHNFKHMFFTWHSNFYPDDIIMFNRQIVIISHWRLVSEKNSIGTNTLAYFVQNQ